MKAVMYHYVREYRQDLPNFRFLDIGNFRKQLDYFGQAFGFVTFEEWCQYLENGSLPAVKGKVLLTFDDALSCHYHYVYQELKSRNLWGMFYVPTSPYTDRRILDVHRIHLLCGAFNGTKLLEFTRSIVSDEMIPDRMREEFQKETYLNQTNYDGVSEFKRLLNYFIDYQYRSAVVDAIAKKFQFQFNAADFYLTPEQIAEMAKNHMLVGSHTRNHPVMSKLSASEQAAEIESSFALLSSICKMPIRTYCHPFGGFLSFNQDTVRLLNESDVKFSFSVESREINGEDRIQSKQFLPRFDCNQYDFGRAS
jgi:peptidoglycan/xylan/chitin deacetylase (PgdA/CDA1 family)